MLKGIPRPRTLAADKEFIMDWLLTCSIGILSGVWGQVETAPNVMNWVQILTNLGSFAVIVFGLVVFLPRAFEHALTSYKEVVKTHAEVQDSLSKIFRETIHNMGMTFKEELEAVRQRADARADRMSERLSGSIAQNTEAVNKNTDALMALEKQMIERRP
jgi:hypothetical protein